MLNQRKDPYWVWNVLLPVHTYPAWPPEMKVLQLNLVSFVVATEL